MVRPDHEDGAVLSSDDDLPGETTPEPKPAPVVVRKSSPLGRKPKPRPTGTAGKDDDVDPVESAPEETVAESDDDGAVSVESAAESASYRDRRVAAQRRRTAKEAAAAQRRSTVGGNVALKVVALILGVVLLVTGTVLSILFGVRYQRIEDEQALRAEYATFARQVVVQMTTLDAENADAMYKLAMDKTSGRAQQAFRDNMKQVTDLIRQGDAVTKTTVLTEAVSEAEPDEGTVLMVVGWEGRSKDGKTEPMFQTFRYRVGMTRINGDLKLTDLEFVL